MLIDCFSYFNEAELLELRLKLLYDKVDRFIITEADHTHSGKPKSLTLLDTLKTIDVPLDKIIYVHVQLPSAEEEPNHWVRERRQRDAAKQFIKDDDIVFVSDCDEILNPDHINYLEYVKKNHPNNILRVPLVFLCGRADLRVHNDNNQPISWNTPFFVSGKQLKNYTLSMIREDHAWGIHNLKDTDILITEDGVPKEFGWHFTWMGNLDRIQLKENSYCHSGEYSVSSEYIAIEGSNDPIGRPNHILKKYDISKLPSSIYENDVLKDFLLP